MKRSVVSVVKGPKNPDEREVEDVVRRSLELVGGLTDIVRCGDTVLIKPNVVMAQSPDTGTTTDPRVCKSLANIVKEMGASPVIGEASAHGIDTEQAFQVAGYGKLREEGFEVLDLKRQERVRISVPGGKSLKQVTLPKVVLGARAIISVPKMKTHDQVQVTLSLKNMKGVLPDALKKKFHTTFGVFQSVADLCTVARPALAVVDGIVAQEGWGPMFGKPVKMGLIVAGKDPVAVDAVTAAIMGFDPSENRIIMAAEEAGIGISDLGNIEVLGESLSAVKRRFRRPEEVMQETVRFPDGFRLILDEKACTGCRNSVLTVLVDLMKQNQLDRAAGWCVVAGKIDKVPEVDRRHLLLAGNCTAGFKRRGVFVRGCPPLFRDVASGILGEEQASWSR